MAFYSNKTSKKALSVYEYIPFGEFSADSLEEDLKKLKKITLSLPFYGLFLRADLAVRVLIYAFLTAAIAAETLYLAAGIKSLSREDSLNNIDSPWSAALIVLPKRITFIDNNLVTRHLSFAKTPDEFFQSKNISIGEYDNVNPAPESPLDSFSPTILVKRAKSITIIDNKQKFKHIGVFDTPRDLFKDSELYIGILKDRMIDLSIPINDGEEIYLNTKIFQRGVASWYGPGFQGRTTASGEIYDMHKISAAHKTLPLGTVTRVINVSNGKWVILNINDRGPYVEPRIIDLSFAAKEKIEMGDLGYVWIEVLKYPDSL